MSSKCSKAVVIKQECTESRDIIIERPISGKVVMYDQGKGVKRSVISVAGELKGNSCKIYGENCSGTAEIGTTETKYAGTPYTISTVRCFE